MISQEVKTIKYENGEIQRYHIARLDTWENLHFFRPEYSPRGYKQVCELYKNYIVPKCPWIFGQMVLFTLPEQIEIPEYTGEKYGKVASPLTAATLALRRGVRIIFGKPVFLTRGTKELWRVLEEQGCVTTALGRLPFTTVLPVGRETGYMSECAPDAPLKINAGFFIMDRFDCATPYDTIGTPIGLCVEDGKVLNPPAYGRETLIVKNNGAVEIRQFDARDAQITIGGNKYRHGGNATIYARPKKRKTPRGKNTELVIISNRVEAVRKGGGTLIPSSGFVLSVKEECDAKPGDEVKYSGFEDVQFAVQAGCSTVIDGKVSTFMKSPFYNIRRLWSISYPPSLYPLNYDNDRAPRTAIGADRDGKPMLLWLEGPGKRGYTPGEDSRGATLRETAEICAGEGMENGVNMDGGGSAQMLIRGERSLKISDRNSDNSERERAVPIGIFA